MNDARFKYDEIAAGQATVLMGPGALETYCKVLSEQAGRIFVLTDTNTERDCLPILASKIPIDTHFSMPAGESSKHIGYALFVWQHLTAAHFGRGDLLINLGGGVVCDLGGFAASTYKRGIAFIHIPTTLLAMADASVGGKTGIDFVGFKNQLGTFQDPRAVVIHTPFLETLPQRELLSGYAEVLKHLLISDAAGWEKATETLPNNWDDIVARAIRIKVTFTDRDPLEQNVRKALNFGHTIGHAIESHFLAIKSKKIVLHGEAVAAGMLCEAWLSLQRGLLSTAEYDSIRKRLQTLYKPLPIKAKEIPTIAEWCLQDKKNAAGQIQAVLLDGIGRYSLDQRLTLNEIEDSLRHYLSLPS